MIEQDEIASSSEPGLGARPNLFIVGAPKSGTTALATYLDRHPDVHVAPKELSYFGTDLDFRTRKGRPWSLSLDSYLSWFAPYAGRRYLCDRSVFYLYSGRAASEIAEFDPGARVLVILRDPVEQMYSQHSEMLYQGDEDILDFAKALGAEDARRAGERIPPGCQKAFGLLYRDLARYAVQVDRYFTTLGRERVCVLVYDDLAEDAARTHLRVLEFLELAGAEAPEFSVVNPNKQLRSRLAMRMLHRPSPRLRQVGRMFVRNGQSRAVLRRRIQALNTRHRPRPPMPDALRRELREEFQPEIERLENLLDRDLRTWRGHG